MQPSRRERVRAATQQEIKAVARQQMADQGAAALSLRAIATAMGMAAPSLYNYYSSRDDLITDLIIEAYTSLGEAVQHAGDGLSQDDIAAQLLAGALAYRVWAVAHPAEYTLITGTPIPGYQAPDEVTTPLARGPLIGTVQLLAGGWRAGTLTIPPEYAEVPADLARKLAPLRSLAGHDAPLALIHLGLAIWARLQGMVTLELTNHLRPLIGDAEAFYRFEVEALGARLGLRS